MKNIKITLIKTYTRKNHKQMTNENKKQCQLGIFKAKKPEKCRFRILGKRKNYKFTDYGEAIVFWMAPFHNFKIEQRAECF